MPAAPTRYLKRWDNAMSDGCSVPALLRLVVPQETPEECSVCQHHDEAYYYGGSARRRRAADRRFRRALVKAGMWPPKAFCYWVAVRLGGAPWYRVEGVSWAFGGSYFKYSREPALPADEPRMERGPGDSPAPAV